MSDSNMFRDCGICGFYVNYAGYRQNLILVEHKDKSIIYCKDSIPLGCKVYKGVKDEDCIYIGTVEECIMQSNTIGNIHEITLYDSPNVSDQSVVYTPNRYNAINSISGVEMSDVTDIEFNKNNHVIDELI